MRQRVDKSLVRERFARSLSTYDRAAVVQRRMAEDLVEALRETLGMRCAEHVLELGCGTGLLTRRLLESFAIERLTAVDLADDAEPCIRRIAREYDAEVAFLPGDMETVDLPGSVDAIVASAAFQWAEHPRRLLRRLAEHIQVGGVLAFTSFAPGNLREVDDLAGEGLRYATLNEHVAWLEEDCEILVAREDEIAQHFDSPRDVLRSLIATGVTGVKRLRWTPSTLAAFEASYNARYRNGRGVRLTYKPLWVVARRKPYRS